MDQLNEIVERLRYATISFSELEIRSADDFELKENMVVHWNDRYSSSRAFSSGVVVSSFAVQDSLQGPVVMIYDGEMCFLSNPSELFATESGIYGFIVSGVKPLPFRVGGCKSHSEKQFEILYYYDYNDNQVVVKKQHKSSLRLRTVGMTEKYVRACGVSIRLSLVKATDDEAGSPDPLGSRVIHVAIIDMSEVPRETYRQVNRGFGNEFFVFDPSKAKVIKVVPRKEAFRIDREQDKYVPQSHQELSDFYDQFH